MRRIDVNGYQPNRDEAPEPVQIVISGHFHVAPKDVDLRGLGESFDNDARALFDALSNTLPGGTLVRLESLLLQDRAQKTFFIVRDDRPRRPAPVEPIEPNLLEAAEVALIYLEDGAVHTAADRLRAAIERAKLVQTPAPAQEINAKLLEALEATETAEEHWANCDEGENSGAECPELCCEIGFELADRARIKRRAVIAELKGEASEIEDETARTIRTANAHGKAVAE